MKFRELAELCEKLSSTKKRLEMIDLVADFMRKLGPLEVGPAVCMLLGRPFPETEEKKLEINWTTLKDIILRLTGAEPKEMAEAFGRTGDMGEATEILFGRSVQRRFFAEKPLELLDVHGAMRRVAEIRGPRARERKERILEGLLRVCDPIEAKLLVKVIIGEMRTGFQKGLMVPSLAKAFGLPEKLVHRAVMFAGDVAEVASIASEMGRAELEKLGPMPFRPISPMLAQVASSVEEAIQTQGGRAALEFKLDGARVQIHKVGEKVRIFSRRLSDVTKSLPEIVELTLREVKAREVIAEGEVIAVGGDGFPLPFQSLLQRFRRERDVETMRREIPLDLQLFDLLYLNGKSLVDVPYEERREKLGEISGGIKLTEQIVTSDPAEGKDFLHLALRAGHEGLIAKELKSPYTPGTRGKKWLKIKPILEPLDLVIVGAEFGYGRRHRWLSDYYLAARDENTGKFEVIGKTFKGLTDEEIEEMTERLEELVIRREGRRVWVLPKIVVEVAFNEIQSSPKYPCGMALRFARITRIRDDKSAEEADTISRVRDLFEKQVKKSRMI